MTNAPATRRTHVCRLFGTNKRSEVLHDISVDIERMDIVKYATQLPGTQWQGAQFKLRWMDDPLQDDYDPNGNPSRIFEYVKVCSPDETDVNDPEEWVNVPVIKAFRTLGAGGNALTTNGRMYRHLNSSLNLSRSVEVRKIPHYDTNIDDIVQAATDADPSLLSFVVPGDQYVKDLTSKDASQFVNHEIIMHLKSSGNITGIDGQRNQFKLLNQYLIDESDDPDDSTVGALGINPPYRLDPFQNIVNLNFGGVAVEYQARSL